MTYHCENTRLFPMTCVFTYIWKLCMRHNFLVQLNFFMTYNGIVRIIQNVIESKTLLLVTQHCQISIGQCQICQNTNTKSIHIGHTAHLPHEKLNKVNNNVVFFFSCARISGTFQKRNKTMLALAAIFWLRYKLYLDNIFFQKIRLLIIEM